MKVRSILPLLVVVVLLAPALMPRHTSAQQRGFGVTQTAAQATASAPPMTSLTPEDLTLLAEGFSPMERQKLSGSLKERKKLAEDIRQLLAVANEAHRKGYADRPEIKRQLEMMRIIIVAKMYSKKQLDAKAEGWMPKPEEIEAFAKSPENMKQVEDYMEDLERLGLVPEGMEITDEVKERFRHQWAPMALLAQRGGAAGIEGEYATQLQIRFQQAVVLDTIYEAELA